MLAKMLKKYCLDICLNWLINLIYYIKRKLLMIKRFLNLTFFDLFLNSSLLLFILWMKIMKIHLSCMLNKKKINQST